MPENAVDARFCCAGCAAVYALIREAGLSRFYELAGTAVSPAPSTTTPRSTAWLEPMLAEAERGASVSTLELDVQGLSCAACVWLINELFRREPGGVSVTVNPALGRMRLCWRAREFDALGFVRRVESFGYLIGPALRERARDDLTLRLGASAALTLNVMLFSVSFYFGLGPEDGALFQLFSALSVVLASTVVVVGGAPFFRAAFRGLTHGLLHLDLPIALGIALVYLTCLIQAQAGRVDRAYFDTLCTFITLMLVGRWLQRRLVEKNRQLLLEDGGLAGLRTRRVQASGLSVIDAGEIRSGDELLIAPGELVPVDAVALEDGAVSLEWISGESEVREVPRGELLMAGAFNAGHRGVRVTARGNLATSGLATLMRKPAARSATGAERQFWESLSRGWAKRVLFVASTGFLVWLPFDATRALDVAAAILVVTCPCAIGLSIPLAYELVHARLRAAGFYARGDGVLDQLLQVRKVIFDKTGTLTSNRLSAEGLPALTESERHTAYNLACRSPHPASVAISQWLHRQGARFDSAFVVDELPGNGLSARLDDSVWNLGRAGWALPGGAGDACVLSRDGQRVATFEFAETLRPHAEDEVARLKQRGCELWIISGDAEARVQAIAGRLGVPKDHALGAQRPEDKAAAVAQLDRADTLYIGDGVNDALAFEHALCRGTVAIERPVLPSRSDFFVAGDSLAPISASLELAHELRTVVRGLLRASMTYNVLAVTACLAGAMSPLRAAVFMPLSSLSLLFYTRWRLRKPARTAASLVPVEVTA